MYSFSYLEPVCFSMSGSDCCFLTCTQISREAGQVVWCSHLFQNFPQWKSLQLCKNHSWECISSIMKALINTLILCSILNVIQHRICFLKKESRKRRETKDSSLEALTKARSPHYPLQKNELCVLFSILAGLCIRTFSILDAVRSFCLQLVFFKTSNTGNQRNIESKFSL